jgi:hypothetical protein
LKAGPVLNFGEGESKIVTYTSAADKMKIFSAFIREGLENGDLVDYSYPDEESETVRAKLREYGIDVEKHESNGSLNLSSQTEYLMPDGKFDNEKAIRKGLEKWAEAKRKGYKHYRDLEDLGDFSFINGQWQKYVTEYWRDPRWTDPDISKWVERTDLAKAIYEPFLIELTAINVEHMIEQQVIELLKAFGEGAFESTRFIDLLQDINSFSRSIDLDHERLIGRRILLEFDPVSNYEKVVDRLAKESRANVEPLFVFTSKTSSIHSYLFTQSAIKFFLTSISTSIPESISENTVLLPAKNAPLILDALSKVLETYVDTNVCFVFDILSELLSTIGREKTFSFLRQALDMLSPEKITSLFLLNTSAHDAEEVSQLRNLFSNQIAYDKNGLEIMKISQF